MNYIEAREAVNSTLAPLFKIYESNNSNSSGEDVSKIIPELLPIWCVQDQGTVAGHQVGAFLPKRYVIPKQDLKLLESVVSVLTAAAGANYFLHFDTTKGLASVVTGIFIAMLKLQQNLKLSAHLQPFEYALLKYISQRNESGVHAAEILSFFIVQDEMISLEYILQCLNNMMAYPTISGSKSVLVWQDVEARWHTTV